METHSDSVLYIIAFGEWMTEVNNTSEIKTRNSICQLVNPAMFPVEWFLSLYF